MFGCFSSRFVLFVAFLFQIYSAVKHDKVPAGLRPAKALNEQQQQPEKEETFVQLQNDSLPSSTIAILRTNNNSSRTLIFHKNERNGRGNGDPLGVAFLVINGTETSTAKARITIPPPIGKDFGVNTILQTNLVDSQGHVLKGVSSVQLPLTDNQQKTKTNNSGRASARQVDAEENAIPNRFSGQRAKETHSTNAAN